MCTFVLIVYLLLKVQLNSTPSVQTPKGASVMKCQSFSPVKQKSSLDVENENVIHPAHPQIEPITILFRSQIPCLPWSLPESTPWY